MKINTNANRKMNRRYFIIIGIIFCFFIFGAVNAEAEENKTVILPSTITGDTAAGFDGGTCPEPYKDVIGIDIVNAFIGENRECLFVAIPKGRFITFSFPDSIKHLTEGILTIETTGADGATSQVSAILNDNTEQILGSIRETKTTQITTFSLDQECIRNLKVIKIEGTNNAGQYDGADVVSIYIESEYIESDVEEASNEGPFLVFKCNGGYCKIAKKPLKYGNKYGTLPKAAREGYTFKGWYTKKKYGKKVTKETKFKSKEKDVAIFAHWTPYKYTIKFKANGGTGSMTPMINKSVGKRYVLKKNTFKKTGYRFIGWSTKEGGPIVYSDKASFRSATTRKNGTVTLYAVWTKKTSTNSTKKYTISYNANGGKGSMSASKNLVYGRTYNLKDNTFKRDGYSFTGWSESSGGNVKYHNKEAVRDLSSKDGGKVTLYAVWEPSSSSNGIVTTPRVYGCVIGGCNLRKYGYTHDSSTDFYNKLCKNKIKGYVTDKKLINIHNLAAAAPSRYELDDFIMSDFADTTNKDISFVYYAGHGMGGAPKGEGQGIVLRDIEKKDDYSQAYGYIEFLEMLGDNINGKIILITDMCYSGGFVKAASKTSVKDRICIFTSCAAYQLTDSTQKFGMEKKWDWLIFSNERSVLAATVDVIKREDHRYHCFTYALMEGLNWKKTTDYPADLNKDKVVTCEELSAYIKSNMPNQTGEVPQFYLGKLAKQIIFG